MQMALMKHRGLFELLEKHGRVLLDTKLQTASQATRIAISTMLEELAPNLWEDDLNRLVDFGHLISPALEMVHGPSAVLSDAVIFLWIWPKNYLPCAFFLQKVLPSLLHGEAVNIDMSYMVYVSRESGLLTEEEKRRIIGCMIGLELPVWHEEFTMELIQRSLQDRLKHSGGLVRMPLPVGLGQAGENSKSIDKKSHFL